MRGQTCTSLDVESGGNTAPNENNNVAVTPKEGITDHHHHAGIDDDADDESMVCTICLDSQCDEVGLGGTNTPYADDEYADIYGAGGDGHEFIAPCVCRSYVHRRCLDVWRASAMAPQAMTHCPTCKNAYEYEEETVEHVEKYERSMARHIARRIALMFTIVLMGSLCFWFIDCGTPQWMNLNFNGFNGKIYSSMDGTGSAPQFLVYLFCGFICSALVFLTVDLTISMIQYCRYHHRRRHSNHDRRRIQRRLVHDACCGGCISARRFFYGSGAPSIFSECVEPAFQRFDADAALCTLMFAIAFCVFVAILSGFIFILMFIVGIISKGVDRKCESRQRQTAAMFRRVKDLRPLSSTANNDETV